MGWGPPALLLAAPGWAGTVSVLTGLQQIKHARRKSAPKNTGRDREGTELASAQKLFLDASLPWATSNSKQVLPGRLHPGKENSREERSRNLGRSTWDEWLEEEEREIPADPALDPIFLHYLVSVLLLNSHSCPLEPRAHRMACLENLQTRPNTSDTARKQNRETPVVSEFAGVSEPFLISTTCRLLSSPSQVFRKICSSSGILRPTPHKENRGWLLEKEHSMYSKEYLKEEGMG